MDPQTRREELQVMPLEDLRAMVPQKLDGYESTSPQDLTVSILQALFEFAPHEVGQRNIAVDILASTTDTRAVFADGSLTFTLVRTAGGRTPPVSQPSANVDEVLGSSMLPHTSCDRWTMRELVLKRESYRCIVTGRCDLDSLQTEKTVMQQGEDVTVVATAHILPFTLVPRSNDPLSLQRSDMVWQVIAAFSGISPDELSGDKINRAENGVSLDPAMHMVFRNLSLCFDSTSDANTYQVRTFGPLRDLGLRLADTVSFVSRSGVPVPDPRYLALHAACTKVLHKTGIARIIEKHMEDLERTPVLSSDGSSAHLLRHALEMIASE
ncbi:hypothetical protein FS837_012408 [Tulasnella sp. UAMH 9824]|nr:hypothetical protein FS837_012408 [Tulasnella sp. UAMH 9824]